MRYKRFRHKLFLAQEINNHDIILKSGHSLRTINCFSLNIKFLAKLAEILPISSQIYGHVHKVQAKSANLRLY
ncbi:TPA: hypothetical protein F8R96_12100 [Legionella pneumophila]|nr:hypothetical protein [Legionella pneumophila]HAU1321669.1 hypothetical protein [Legionella pneumophila]